MTPPLVRPDVETHRSARRLSGVLAPGTVIPATETRTVLVPIAGASRFRVRVKITGGVGTIDVSLCSVDEVAYLTNQPSQVALADNVENIVIVAETACGGEPWAKVIVTAGGAPVTISFVDFSQVGF